MAVDFLDLLERLSDSGLEFVIVGGVAARLHGSPRLTHDLDIVPNLEVECWARAIDTLWGAGARARVPEPRERIRDAKVVSGWVSEKGMMALTLRSPDGAVEIDFLVGRSDRFADLDRRATRVDLDGRVYRIAHIDDLIQMKREAGRPQDLLDVDVLRQIKRRVDSSKS